MAKKLINYQKEEDFQIAKEAGELPETSIVFVDDSKKIFTHNTEFDCSGGIKSEPITDLNEILD